MLRAEFGRDNTYRISGDEFVAVVIDADTETLLRKVRAVEKAAGENNTIAPRARSGAPLPSPPTD